MTLVGSYVGNKPARLALQAPPVEAPPVGFVNRRSTTGGVRQEEPDRRSPTGGTQQEEPNRRSPTGVRTGFVSKNHESIK